MGTKKKRKGVAFVGKMSIYNWFLIPISHFVLPTVTHDLDVVVKGNLSLFEIWIAYVLLQHAHESQKCVCVCACARVSHLFFRRLPGVVQRAWALYPGAERLALRLPDWMEWAWMQRCHGNWLQWWNRQRRRWHSKHHLSFSISFSLPYLFHFCLSGRLSIPFHYFRSCFPCREIFLIVPPLHPSVPSQSCWDSCRVLLFASVYVGLVFSYHS